MNVAYVTAGTVGAGHLVRGLAIGRGLARAGFPGRYRMFGPRLPFEISRRGDYEAVAIEGPELATPERAPSSALARALEAFAPDLVVVDLFWAPLRHVLPVLRADAWLLVRSCPAWWFGGPRTARWEPSMFSRVLAIEPIGLDDVVRERIEPIVVCNRDELRPPGSLRARLGVRDGERLVVATHAGVPGEHEQIAARAGAGRVVRCDLFAEDAIFPLAEWLDDADEIHGAAGYNSFWEARTLGWLDRYRMTPLQRSLDDQAWRVRACGSHVPSANGADLLARAIVSG